MNETVLLVRAVMQQIFIGIPAGEEIENRALGNRKTEEKERHFYHIKNATEGEKREGLMGVLFAP